MRSWELRDSHDQGRLVYFIEGAGLIKIGSSNRLNKRFAEFQRYCPVELQIIHAFEGVTCDETALHRMFDKHRKHGEWVEKHKDIIDFINLPLLKKKEIIDKERRDREC